ncbi:MAG: MFS transporter [Pseudomonadota bacterium]
MRFERAQVRQGEVPFGIKVFQAVGGIAGATKDLIFRSFLLLYYNQVLGVPASTASIVLLIALIVDAVSDPLVGSYSDNLKHQLGRRHPLMFAAIIPFTASIYFLLAPPELSASATVVWFLLFTVLTRFTFTFYVVPWSALFSELTDDYTERSSLLAYRAGVGWLLGIIFVVVSYGVIFTAGDGYERGQLNPENYPPFAIMSAGVVFISGLITTLATRGQIPYLRQPTSEQPRFSFLQTWGELKLALQNRDMLFLFLAVLASSVVIGTNQAFEIYMNTYFWEFGGEQLQYMGWTAVGGLAAFLTVIPLQKRFDKKVLLVGCSVLIMFVTAVPVTLRLLGLAPENGTSGIVVLVVGTVTVNAYLATVALTMFGSMLADTIDLQELRTGLRQEGLFNSAITFSGKATTGWGIVIAGFLLDYVVGLPPAAEPEQITQDMVWRIAVLDGYVVPLFNVVWLWLAMQYSIDRKRHAQIRAELDGRSGVDSSNTGGVEDPHVVKT